VSRASNKSKGSIPADELARLAAGVEKTAQELVGLVGALQRSSDTAPLKGVAALARHLYRMRRMRDLYFKSELFGEAAWDILLDLYVARVEKQPISTTSACIGAAVPHTTALRWLRQLESEGLVTRHRPRRDERIHLIEITDEGYARMTSLLVRLSALLADLKV
jgi:DNA-binding transcriptional ArsR family regulator